MIGRKSLLIVISTLVSSILAFVGLLAMTNYLGTDAYGTISWVLATLTTLNVVSDLGFGSAHIKRLSEGQDQNDCVSTYIVFKIILIAFMVFFVLTVLLVWNNLLGGSISPATWNLTILFVLYFVMYDLSSIAVNTFTAKMETTKTQLVALIDPFIRVPLVVLISVNRLPSDLAYGYVFAAMGVMLLSLFLLKKKRLQMEETYAVPFISQVRPPHIHDSDQRGCDTQPGQDPHWLFLFASECGLLFRGSDPSGPHLGSSVPPLPR